MPSAFQHDFYASIISTILFVLLTTEDFIVLLTLLNPSGIIFTRKWLTMFWVGPQHKCKENWLTQTCPWVDSKVRQSFPQCFSKWSSWNHKKHRHNRGGSVSPLWVSSGHLLLNSMFLKLEHKHPRDLRILWFEHPRKMVIWFWIWWP